MKPSAAAWLTLAIAEGSGSEVCRLGPDDTAVKTGWPPPEVKTSLYILTAASFVDEGAAVVVDGGG
jgi:hypothetical protein